MNVLLTGATGTFGRMFLRQIFERPLMKVRALARSESRLALQADVYKDQPGYRALVGDVRDEARMRDACHGVDWVIHAAALKRIETGTYNGDEMVKTNVEGTRAVVRAAWHAGVKRVLVISSDKAVQPTTFYGQTKAMAEQLAIQANTYSGDTEIAAVRYGNVLGSTGSVLQIWKAQRDAGQPITVMDPTMTRFIISIRDAVEFSIHAIEHMRRGEIHVPVMTAVSIGQLASAYASSAEVTIVPIRPGGEKHHEVLMTEAEQLRAVKGPYGWIIEPDNTAWTHRPRTNFDRWPAGEVYASGNKRFHVVDVAELRNMLIEALVDAA